MSMEAVMNKRVKAYEEEVAGMWQDGKGSILPDFDPEVEGGVKASRETEELLHAIVKNDLQKVYQYIEEGADVNFVFGEKYSCPEGYTPLMAAAHRTRLEACKALLRAGADPNYMNEGGDLTLFWAIDGGIEIIKLLVEYGADMDARNDKDWTPLSYSRARGKYGKTYEKGIYPEDVLLYYGATEYGSGPPHDGAKSPRNSYDPEADDFMRERGSYQAPINEP